MKTPSDTYRRAVYKHSYATIYRIDADTLTSLDVYHTS